MALQTAAFLLLPSLLHLAAAQTALAPSSNGTSLCSTTVPFNGQQITYTHCAKLQSRFSLAWTYDNASQSLDFWFRGLPETTYGWVGWGLSESGNMFPSNVTVGFAHPNDRSLVKALPYYISSRSFTGVTPNEGLSLSAAEVDYTNNGNLIHIRGKIAGFPAGLQRIIWQGGPPMEDYEKGTMGVNQFHTDDTTFWGRTDVDFSTGGTSAAPAVTASNLNQKIVHAWLSAIGFGVLMPLGIIVARHIKVFVDPLWFYTHIALQTLGYLLGLVGWGYGIWLRNQRGSLFASLGANYQIHFAIGVTIFCTASLQLITPAVKPGKHDPVRLYWNLGHWFLGYLTVILSVTNIFYGFYIMLEQKINYGGWRTAYIAFLSVWAVIFVVLEPISWYFYLQKTQDEDYDEDEDGKEADDGEEGDEEEGQYEEEEEEEQDEEGSYDDDKGGKYRDD